MPHKLAPCTPAAIPAQHITAQLAVLTHARVEDSSDAHRRRHHPRHACQLLAFGLPLLPCSAKTRTVSTTAHPRCCLRAKLLLLILLLVVLLLPQWFAESDGPWLGQRGAGGGAEEGRLGLQLLPHADHISVALQQGSRHKMGALGGQELRRWG